MCIVGGGPVGEEVFLWKVEVRMGDALGGGVFRHGHGGGAEVQAVVFSAGLEEETFGDYRGEIESREEVG